MVKIYNFKNKIFAMLGLSEICCPKCGGYIKPNTDMFYSSYYDTICQECRYKQHWTFGNLAESGKGNLYKIKKK